MLNKPLLLSCGEKSLINLLKTADFWFDYGTLSFTLKSGHIDTYYKITFGDMRNRSASCSENDYAKLTIYSPSTFDIFYAPLCALYSENIAIKDNYYGACLLANVFRGTVHSDGTSNSQGSLNWCTSSDNVYGMGHWFEKEIVPLGANTNLAIPSFMAFWKDGIPDWVSTYYTNLDSYETSSGWGPEIS